jgi:hypothetical protein
LEEFLQSDRWILERVDDSAGCIGTAYRRACQLFARAAPGVASPAALAERIALLVEKDDYGVRHSLLEHVPQFLDNETIARLVDRWRKQAVQGPGSRRDRMPLLRIETLAASTGNPQLYAEAALDVKFDMSVSITHWRDRVYADALRPKNGSPVLDKSF